MTSYSSRNGVAANEHTNDNKKLQVCELGKYNPRTQRKRSQHQSILRTGRDTGKFILLPVEKAAGDSVRRTNKNTGKTAATDPAIIRRSEATATTNPIAEINPSKPCKCGNIGDTHNRRERIPNRQVNGSVEGSGTDMLLKDIREYSGIFLAIGCTDLRKAVDGLAHRVKDKFRMDPFGNYLFLFCNKSRNKMKGLTWDKNGFWLCYKRLDGMGAKFAWPNTQDEVRDISVSQLEDLLSGLSVDTPRGFGDITSRDF
jgi:transposase